MNCPKCNAEIPAGKNFCVECVACETAGENAAKPDAFATGTAQTSKSVSKCGRVRGKFIAAIAITVACLIIGTPLSAQQKNLTNQLMAAIDDGEPETVEDLVDQGADVNAKDEDGNTALMRAVMAFGMDEDIDDEEIMEIIKYLVKKGADVNASNKQGATALMLVSDVNIAKYLVSKGADINRRDNSGQTVLISVIDNTAEADDGLALVEYFVNKGLNVNAKDNDGRTPLMAAAEGDHIKTVKYLVGKGANVNARDNEGNTALDLTTSNSVKKYLCAQGAK